MKKLICVFLAVLLLAGCSVRPQPEESALPTDTDVPYAAPTAERPTEPEAPEPGLYELCSYTEANGYRPLTVAARGSEAAVLLNRWPADPDQTTCYLQLLNLDTGEASEILPLEGSEDDDAYRITLEADGTLVFYHPYQDTAAHYDRQGNLLGRVENPCPAPENPQFPHELANTRFTFQDTLAWYHSYAEERYLFTAYAFADEPEALYLVEGGYDSVRCAEGKRLLESAYLHNNGGLSYRVLDLEAGVELDRLTIENDAVGEARENTFFNEGDAVICEAGAVLRVERTYYEPGVEYGEDGPEPEWTDRIYFWRLDDAAAGSLDLRRVTEEELRAENEALAASIGERWELNVLLDVAPEGDRPPMLNGDDPEAYQDATLITGIEALPTYELLLQMERFLSLLPEGFVHEMQTDYPPIRDENGLEGFEGFDIYVIKEIPGSSSAYANGWAERLKIVLATDEFTPSTLPHEFMHLIARRVYACYDARGESFWEGWVALNPEGFDYYDEKDEQALVNDYFVSYYAMTNSDEDEADTFMYMFTAQQPFAECWWYKDAPHIQAKVAYLMEAIRGSFPSVQSVERAYWEGK